MKSVSKLNPNHSEKVNSYSSTNNLVKNNQKFPLLTPTNYQKINQLELTILELTIHGLNYKLTHPLH